MPDTEGVQNAVGVSGFDCLSSEGGFEVKAPNGEAVDAFGNAPWLTSIGEGYNNSKYGFFHIFGLEWTQLGSTMLIKHFSAFCTFKEPPFWPKIGPKIGPNWPNLNFPSYLLHIHTERITSKIMK